MRRGADLTGFSGLGALLSGAADGFTQGQRIASQRNADKLAREREERYERERQAQEEERRLARERQRALDAMAGLVPGEMATNEQITLRDNSAVREGVGDAGRALSSLTGSGFESLGTGLTAMAPGIANQTTNRFERIAGTDYARDRSIADPEVKRIRAEEEDRVERGNARRGLLALRGPDGEAPLFRPEEVLGQDGDTLKAMRGEAALAPLRARQQAALDAKAEAAKAQTVQAAADVAVQMYGVSPDVATSAAQSGLLPTIIKGIEDQRNDQRALNRGIALARETDRLTRERTAGTGTPGAQPTPLLKTSEDQLRSVFHYQLASEAADKLAALDNPSLLGEVIGKTPVIGNVLQNKARPNQAALEQAGKQFVESYIFAITGAAAPESQIERLMATVVPRAGDSEDVLSRKKATRDIYLQGLRARSGNAYLNAQAQGLITSDGKVVRTTVGVPSAPSPEDNDLAKAMYQNLLNAGVDRAEAQRQVTEAFGGNP